MEQTKEQVNEITLQELIQNLNGDLKAEYSATIQYLNHSYLAKGKERAAIVAEFIEHAQQEYVHAQTIGNEIVRLGGTPKVAVDISPLVLENDALIKQDLDWENKAVAGYRHRIREAESLGELGLASKLTDILALEEEHVLDLKRLLEQ